MKDGPRTWFRGGGRIGSKASDVTMIFLADFPTELGARASHGQILISLVSRFTNAGFGQVKKRTRWNCVKLGEQPAKMTIIKKKSNEVQPGAENRNAERNPK